MSKEAFGDEGNMPSDIKDTALWQEFEKLDFAFQQWRKSYMDEFPNDEIKARVEDVEQAFSMLYNELEELE